MDGIGFLSTGLRCALTCANKGLFSKRASQRQVNFNDLGRLSPTNLNWLYYTLLKRILDYKTWYSQIKLVILWVKRHICLQRVTPRICEEINIGDRSSILIINRKYLKEYFSFKNYKVQINCRIK